MKKILFTSILFLFIKKGFTQNFQLEVFELTANTQTASFYIGTGWVGISASMPIIDANYRPKRLNEKAIYFDESYEKIVSEKLPDCFVDGIGGNN